jgi:hypothetical protein
MRLRVRPRHLITVSALAGGIILFYSVGGFPLQVAVGLTLICWGVKDSLQRKRYRP